MENAALLSGKADDRNNRSPVSGSRSLYYELLKEREELWDENLLTIQGHLEKLTVPGRDGREPKYIPPGGKLPFIFGDLP